ncbi:outer membrane protein assembly factor [Vibrio sp. SM6]|uniref:Translocation and assembly module subunit TamA n=1 Tax=Vibrio agarilyticus TaxID=2726741 RepID=A0A7X8TPU4_9VIBR|nr:autotransporter assembly complex family protein [Vibrio agarilyticus]NLS12421.1 outer membrane protein assembly factor [Vibrio agarilyticus]
MSKYYALLGLALTLLAAPLRAEVDLKIQGISGEPKKNVDAYLSSIPKKQYSTSLRFQARLGKSIQDALNAVGYYNAKIDYRVSDDKKALVVDITLGPPVRYQIVDVKIDGEAKNDSEFIKLVAKDPMQKGKVLNHGQYESLKSSIRNLALQRGYFKGRFTKHELEVSPELEQAFVYLYFDSGIRYQFGETTVTGSQIRTDRVLSLLPYKQGAPYQLKDVGELNQNLSNTGWYKSVFVEPDLKLLDSSRELPMRIDVTPQVKNQLGVGLGYATDDGARATLSWKKPWVGSRGNSFDGSVKYSKPEKVLTAGYQIPLEDVLRDYYRIEFGLKKIDNNDTRSTEGSMAVYRYWRLQDDWHRAVFLRYLLESYTQGDQDATAHYWLPGFSFSRTRARGASFPMWGDKQSVTVEFGSKALLSEADLVRVTGRQMWIRSHDDKIRGIARLDAGANVVSRFELLPPSLRFFAGGENSIRGYSYESISPRDSTGALTGGEFMVTGSLEAQYRLKGDWWGAVFVDSGDAFNKRPDWKTGVGFGLRWVLPIGPVRIDFAWGLDEKPGDKFRLEFTLGPEL